MTAKAKYVAQLPQSVTARIKAVCRKLSVEVPVYVPCAPKRYCKRGHCYTNVEKTVERFGGEAVYGWTLWELPGVWLYAEHHCIWRQPDGELLCVTRQQENEARILFLAGANPNERNSCSYLPYSDDPLLLQAVEHQRDSLSLKQSRRFAIAAQHDEQVGRLLLLFLEKRANAPSTT